MGAYNVLRLLRLGLDVQLYGVALDVLPIYFVLVEKLIQDHNLRRRKGVDRSAKVRPFLLVHGGDLHHDREGGLTG